MTDTPEVVKLKRERDQMYNLLVYIRKWLLLGFEDCQDFIDEGQHMLSCINGVIKHEDDLDEFLCGADDDVAYVSPVPAADDTSGSRSDSGGVA